MLTLDWVAGEGFLAHLRIAYESLLRRVAPSSWPFDRVGEADLGLILWPRKQWRLLAEGDDAHLDEAPEVGVGVSPLVEVGQVDLAAGVHVLAFFDHHVGCGLHKGYGAVIRMGVL